MASYLDEVEKKLTTPYCLESGFLFPGAGRGLEALEEGKPLVVLVNEKVLANHQLGLARRLHKEGYLCYCTCSEQQTLPSLLKSVDLSSLKLFPPGKPEIFSEFWDKVVGFKQ
ncbi:UDP-N-acetylglucosamine transferase subunit ALG13 homolog [Dromiciops gliroides]|uniref:UDP-N-acetylglucosamine transferase subunit ALG13 homolog n=1 Tax=Dromiciops gliroides TaxID=33562 RepID=UPI001CC490E9|nr:UDP-N-acetylglucosamine transferase subunit ALG13 homolog [Dromiciops gliroides]